MLFLLVGSALVTCVLGFCYFVTTFYFFSSTRFNALLNSSSGVDQNTPVHIHHYAPPPAPRKARALVDNLGEVRELTPRDFARGRVVPIQGARVLRDAPTRVIPVVRGKDPAAKLQSPKAMSAMLAWVDASED